MKIVQKVIVYSDFVGEEAAGLAVIDVEDLEFIKMKCAAARECAAVSTPPSLVEFNDYNVAIYKMPNLYDMDDYDTDLFDELFAGGYVLVDDLDTIGLGESKTWERTRVDCVYMRIYTRDPEVVLWTGYIKNTSIEIEVPGFNVRQVIESIMEVSNYE
jgi:hypothetical protein